MGEWKREIGEGKKHEEVKRKKQKKTKMKESKKRGGVRRNCLALTVFGVFLNSYLWGGFLRME